MQKGCSLKVIVTVILAMVAIAMAQTGQMPDEKAKYKTTMDEMHRIAVAIKSYSLDFGHAPRAIDIQELKKQLDIYYIADCPAQDAWGNDFIYRSDEKDPVRYWLASGGSDGKFAGFEQIGSWDTIQGQDIILSNSPPYWIYAPSLNDLPLPEISGDAAQDNYPTRLNSGNDLGIVRHPPAADYSRFHRKGLDSLPTFDPDSQNPWQIDLRSTDISSLDLTDRTDDLFFASFDSKTRWPQKLPPEYDPEHIMELGKNPGLGVSSLHQRGITGKGIGIAIIDQGLLVDHIEYKDRVRLYEEIHCADEHSAMHGPAVASIAVGRTVGVAPDADLYYIAETHGVFRENKFDWDFTHLARSIDRILEIDRYLPEKKKIRVISISVGWNPKQKGYAQVTASVERAKKEGIFVVSSSLSSCYENRFFFNGLNRDPLSDPESPRSYGPGLFWANRLFQTPMTTKTPRERLLVPMDSRCTASPTGVTDYVFYRQGGWSWSIPYIAGLYALACQVRPLITPQEFWETALATGKTVEIQRNDRIYTLGSIVNPVRLIEALEKSMK